MSSPEKARTLSQNEKHLGDTNETEKISRVTDGGHRAQSMKAPGKSLEFKRAPRPAASELPPVMKHRSRVTTPLHKSFPLSREFTFTGYDIMADGKFP